MGVPFGRRASVRGAWAMAERRYRSGRNQDDSRRPPSRPDAQAHRASHSSSPAPSPSQRRRNAPNSPDKRATHAHADRPRQGSARPQTAIYEQRPTRNASEIRNPPGRYASASAIRMASAASDSSRTAPPTHVRHATAFCLSFPCSSSSHSPASCGSSPVRTMARTRVRIRLPRQARHSRLRMRP